MTPEQLERAKRIEERRTAIIRSADEAAKVLHAGLSNQQIWTIDFNANVQTLKSAYEFERERLCNKFDVCIYGSDYLPSYMHQSAGGLKKLAAKKNSMSDELYNACVALLTKWADRQQLIEKVKKYAIKKPSKKSGVDAERERYLAPKQSSENMQKVRNMLGQVIESRYNDLLKYLTVSMEQQVASLKEDVKKVKDFKGLEEIRQNYRDIYWHIFDLQDACHGGKAKLLPGYQKWMAATVKQHAESIRDNFIYKNMLKLAAIIVGKEKQKIKVSESKVLSGNFRGTFEGEILFVFSDHSSFQVRNQVVWKHLNYMFPQFPTTFHQVKFRNGKTTAMVPEKEMVENWAIE